MKEIQATTDTANITDVPNLPTTKLIVFTAPSGAGKTTLAKHCLKVLSDYLDFSVSATTRGKRPKEINGTHYYFVSKAAFKQAVADGKFIEWEEVYDGNYYGTLKSEISRIWQLGKAVIFDVDIEGASSLKRIYGNQVLTIFVKPPSIEVIKDRLIGRKTETNATLLQRVDKAIDELKHQNDFDKLLINDDLAIAKAEAVALVSNFLQIDKLSNNKTQ